VTLLCVTWVETVAVGFSPSGRYSGPTPREGVFSTGLTGERGMIAAAGRRWMYASEVCETYGCASMCKEAQLCLGEIEGVDGII
jgi:hypothetical protein